MTRFSGRALFWAPRALSIAFIAFLSLFALDVFGAGYGFWRTLLGLAIHLIPSFVLIGVLVLALGVDRRGALCRRWDAARRHGPDEAKASARNKTQLESHDSRAGLCHRRAVPGELDQTPEPSG